ncbi:hypothetical protein ACTXT7_016696 [Hymenolepis weldensis]
MILQAIRALVHKIRRRSTGEAIYETPATIPFSPEDETRDSNLSLHSFGSMMDIDEEGELTSPYFSDLEGGSGMSPDYIEDWSTILARQQQLQQLQNQRLKQDGGLESGGTSSRPDAYLGWFWVPPESSKVMLIPKLKLLYESH